MPIFPRFSSTLIRRIPFTLALTASILVTTAVTGTLTPEGLYPRSDTPGTVRLLGEVLAHRVRADRISFIPPGGVALSRNPSTL